MISFYFFTIFCALFFCFNKKIGFIFLLFGCFYLLTVLPSTDLDYDVYKKSYDNAVFVSHFPWFESVSRLNSEPFYVWYTSFFGVIFSFEFPVFLGINFLICITLSFLALKNILDINNYYYFWMFLLPVIFPTIFYFSPRSSISFFAILLGFMFLFKEKYMYALLIIFCGVNLHSQFLPITMMILITFITFQILQKKDKESYIEITLFYGLLFFIFLKISSTLIVFLSDFLSFMPSSETVNSKLRYLTNSRSGFRITSILSILIYPIISYHLLTLIKRDSSLFVLKEDKSKELIFGYMLFAITIYGAVINLAYINEPHLAGRLSRFSDYIGMCLLVPAYLISCEREHIANILIVLLCMISPFIYGTLYYNIHWGLN